VEGCAGGYVSEEGGLWARQMNGGIAGEESARVVGDASGCVVVDPGDGEGVVEVGERAKSVEEEALTGVMRRI
jgi:hypothetical protein